MTFDPRLAGTPYIVVSELRTSELRIVVLSSVKYVAARKDEGKNHSEILFVDGTGMDVKESFEEVFRCLHK